LEGGIVRLRGRDLLEPAEHPSRPLLVVSLFLFAMFRLRVNDGNRLRRTVLLLEAVEQPSRRHPTGEDHNHDKYDPNRVAKHLDSGHQLRADLGRRREIQPA
jgi:hypothetical protein